MEAIRAGYDEAIMLNRDGLVAECTGENLFVVKGETLYTPPLVSGALEGITQDTVMTFARDLGYEVKVEGLARSDLFIADEIFVVGTAAEVSAVNSVDDREIPCPGPITQKIASLYADTVRGKRRIRSLVRGRLMSGDSKRSIEIYDTTLRDGSQLEGISLTVEDKLRIAEQLDSLGVHYIEGGWPGATPKMTSSLSGLKKNSLETSVFVAFGSTRRGLKEK